MVKQVAIVAGTLMKIRTAIKCAVVFRNRAVQARAANNFVMAQFWVDKAEEALLPVARWREESRLASKLH